jgi:DNA-binding transcriptional ArsR family regulator
MAYSKREKFSEEEVWLANIAKALAHPARINILKILNSMDTCMVGSLVDQLPLSQSTVSQHLQDLKKAELITGEIDGPKVCYCINKQTLLKAKLAMDKLFVHIGCC